MNGHPLFFAAVSYSCAVAEPIPSDDCESVKMYVMSGADVIAACRAWLRYDMTQYQGGRTIERGGSEGDSPPPFSWDSIQASIFRTSWLPDR